jgi:hypothetical protein
MIEFKTFKLFKTFGITGTFRPELKRTGPLAAIGEACSSDGICDFYATTGFDFFSAMYFFKARRFFCRLRL